MDISISIAPGVNYAAAALIAFILGVRAFLTIAEAKAPNAGDLAIKKAEAEAAERIAEARKKNGLDPNPESDYKGTEK